ncbi:hypothetical protein PGT21_030842 [Puccinia graminis f. sp. tritici]|uniref:Uncharacterized protein n=1 Tax=Puccinia graminis f. sp. tritici TaxID=56615 RepID=A0A5B0PHS1_PUCGR|nr:hypothetical protein PGT21_030842 [Puccinia graminis f. sp. tritici]
MAREGYSGGLDIARTVTRSDCPYHQHSPEPDKKQQRELTGKEDIQTGSWVKLIAFLVISSQQPHGHEGEQHTVHHLTLPTSAHFQ